MMFLLLLGRVAKNILRLKGTRDYNFKTIRYCSRTKVKSSLILRSKILCNPALGTDAWFKMLLPMGTLAR